MNRKLINENGRYGIFYVDKIVHGRGGPYVKYYYFDGGVKIFDSYPCEGVAKVRKGERYFGKYRPNQTESMICCYCFVPENITEQPKGGWSSLPTEFCSEREYVCWTE